MSNSLRQLFTVDLIHHLTKAIQCVIDPDALEYGEIEFFDVSVLKIYLEGYSHKMAAGTPTLAVGAAVTQERCPAASLLP